MTTHELSIKYSDDLLLSLKKCPQEFEAEARLLLAVKLYELNRLSTGVAAQLAVGRLPLSKLIGCMHLILEQSCVARIHIEPDVLKWHEMAGEDRFLYGWYKAGGISGATDSRWLKSAGPFEQTAMMRYNTV